MRMLYFYIPADESVFSPVFMTSELVGSEGSLEVPSFLIQENILKSLRPFSLYR